MYRDALSKMHAPILTSIMKCLLKSRPLLPIFDDKVTGLSPSFEAGVTVMISPVTCKYMAKPCKGRPKGHEPQGGSGGMLAQKILKLTPLEMHFPAL